MTRWRIALIVAGVALLVVAGLVLVDEVSPRRYLGVATWLLGALVVHDGIVAPVVFALSLAARRAGTRVPFGVIAVVQGALVVVAIVAAVVLPEVLKQSIGSANPSVLPLGYGRGLVVFAITIGALAAIGSAIAWAVSTRRQNDRPADSQT